MTTKPKAKKFRIRRNPGAPGGGQAAPTAAEPDTRPAGTANVQPARARSVPGPRAEAAAAAASAQMQTSPEAQSPVRGQAPVSDQAPVSGQVSSARETGVENDIASIRHEGLTGRQLRMARRVAQKHNLPATSDFDAVRLLRAKGIDPFKRSNMLELVVPQNRARATGSPDAPETVQLPQTIPAARTNLPSTEMSPAERRNRDIQTIQREISNRRRRKLVLLMGRLAFFVMLPTLLAGYYFYSVATPMYAAKSEFLILKADNTSGGAMGLLTGTQFATSQDSIAVQSFLQSKEAMLRLDRDIGYKSHFTQAWIDPIQRLNDNPSNEEAYKTYTRYVKVGYDPTEGSIRMEVTAADPEVSAQFSRSLIAYAEEMANNLSINKRGNQMIDAELAMESAEKARRTAQVALVQLQQKGSVLDPEGVIVSLRSQISTFEIQVQEKELELAALLDNARPNKAKVAGTRADIARLQAVIDRLNQRMISASAGENSLASLSVQIQMAQADLATRDLMLQSALQQVEQTRMEANRQVRYLTTSVQPVPSQEASYPRKFENTILAFLIFSGIYLMFSLTASILREQVSS
ncbi:capsule biosynthesis protein [Parasedimentitalea psychrophila]|uniref:Capsule biosynthesis protein n=1 Tax=Parasedimentitalea psychrophila TaxID=2997337 RepID=A0A9Y2P5E6_9RHOB|nr:capsule biosynthesis protein [Parasedimentitalea psychrophila]WIY23505.1 capsule biosynthesis protein [Parasedimentitalea psychrophila]